MDQQKKNDISYHALIAVRALKHGDRATYLAHLKIINGLKKEALKKKKENDEIKPKR